MAGSIRNVFRKGVKILAVISAVLGLCLIPKYILPNIDPVMNDFIVSGKTAMANNYTVEFHPPGKPAAISTESHFPKYFYDAAAVGDHLQMSVPRRGQYSRLVRNGRVISRTLSEWQNYGILLAVTGLVPLLVFVPVKDRAWQSGILATAALAELFVIGTVIFATVLLSAFGHNC